MRLRWKRFEAALHEHVKSYDARKSMKFWQKVAHFLNSSWEVLPWYPIVAVNIGLAGVALFKTDLVRAEPRVWMAGMAAWALMTTIGHAGLLWNTARTDPQYVTLWLLPLPAETILHFLFRRLVRSSAWLFLPFFVIYGIIASPAYGPILGCLTAVLFAGLQVVLSVTLSLLLVALKINRGVLAPLVIIVVLSIASLNWKPGAQMLFSNAINLSIPGGWLNLIYLKVCTSGSAQTWWTIGPLLGTCATLPFSLRSVRLLHYQGTFRTLQRRRPGLLFMREEQGHQVPDSADDAAIRSGKIICASCDNAGLLRRLVTQALTRRDAVIAEMLRAREPLSSRLFQRLSFSLILYLAVNTQIHARSLEELATFIVGPQTNQALALASFVVSMVLCAIMLSTCISLFFWYASPERSLRLPPGRILRLFPVNYWDAVVVIAKINTLICGVLLPCAAVFSLTPAWLIILRRIENPLSVAPKCLGVLWSISIVAPSLMLFPSVQDGWGRYWPAFLKKLLVFGGLYALAIGMFFSKTLMFDCVLASCLVLALGCWLIYCRRQYIGTN